MWGFFFGVVQLEKQILSGVIAGLCVMFIWKKYQEIGAVDSATDTAVSATTTVTADTEAAAEVMA
jgi:hypothetical protein